MFLNPFSTWHFATTSSKYLCRTLKPWAKIDFFLTAQTIQNVVLSTFLDLPQESPNRITESSLNVFTTNICQSMLACSKPVTQQGIDWRGPFDPQSWVYDGNHFDRTPLHGLCECWVLALIFFLLFYTASRFICKTHEVYVHHGYF